MAQTPEGLIKLRVREILRSERAYFFSPATFGMGRSGVPDIICCIDGFFLAIECKAGKGKPTALQLAEIANIHAAGGMALVINEANLHTLRGSIALLRSYPRHPDSSTDSKATTP